MKKALFAAMMILNIHAYGGGGCGLEVNATVNHQLLFWYVPEIDEMTNIHQGWIGNCYVDSLRAGWFNTYVHVYFHPGDTVYLEYVGSITSPGEYLGDEGCYYEAVSDKFHHYTCSYLTDTLEEYYKYHFDHHFLDSLAASQKAYDDSLAALPPSIYPDPVGDVLKIECFKTVPSTSDFQVFDLQGRCVFTSPVSFTDSYQVQTIDMTGLQPGTYVAKYYMNSRQYRRQIVKL